MRPYLTEKALDKLRPGWRERIARKKSPWNLVCGLLGIGLGVVSWFQLTQVAWTLHLYFHPEHRILGETFLVPGHPRQMTFLMFLMMAPLIIPGIIIGMLASNCIMWCIPLIRRIMDTEAASDKEMTFSGSNAGLIKYGGLLSALCFMISFIGAFFMGTIK